MKSHCRLILILAIAYSLSGLLSYTAQTKVKSADQERAAQMNEGSESRSLAERSSDSNARFNPHFNHLVSPALAEAAWTRPFSLSPQASATFCFMPRESSVGSEAAFSLSSRVVSSSRLRSAASRT